MLFLDASDNIIYTLSGNDIVYGGIGNDAIYGGEGDDFFRGGGGNDILDGGEGNDKLYGDYGNDILIGGTGNDYLEGGSGSKTYRFSKGDGNDLINNYDRYNMGYIDIIEFTDVNSHEATLRGENYDLIIDYGQGDSIRILNFFKGAEYVVHEIHFADKQLKYSDLQKTNIPVVITQEDVQLSWGGVVTTLGTSGNDTLTGGVYSDIIYAGAGDDVVYGEMGSDILIGGKGDDYLVGGTRDRLGYGNKTYRFSSGDGNDTINNYDAYNDGSQNDKDIIQLMDISKSSVTYYGENYDLIIKYGESDSIRIEGFFKGKQYWINEIRFIDGVTTTEDLSAMNIPLYFTETVDLSEWKGSVTLIEGTKEEQEYILEEGGTGHNRYTINDFTGKYKIVDQGGNDIYSFSGISNGAWVSIVDEEGFDTYRIEASLKGNGKDAIYNITDKDGQGEIYYLGKKLNFSSPENWRFLSSDSTTTSWAYNNEWTITHDKRKNELTITSYNNASLNPTVIITDFKEGDLGVSAPSIIQGQYIQGGFDPYMQYQFANLDIDPSDFYEGQPLYMDLGFLECQLVMSFWGGFQLVGRVTEEAYELETGRHTGYFPFTYRNKEGTLTTIFIEVGIDIAKPEDFYADIHGGRGDDLLTGYDYENNWFVGGKGDDYIIGGTNGKNIYEFSKGDGNDVIDNFDLNNGYEASNDFIQFMDVTSDEVNYHTDGNDLVIEYGTTDSVRVLDFFRRTESQIDFIWFADGTAIYKHEIQGLIDAQNSRSANAVSFMELGDNISIENNPESTLNTSLRDSLLTYEKVDQVSSIPNVNQELHSLINAMASFDAGNSDKDFMTTDNTSLTQSLLTSSSY